MTDLIKRLESAEQGSREHTLGDDWTNDAIWQGVMDCRITLHMDAPTPHAIVKTPDGSVRADIGDRIQLWALGEFSVLKTKEPSP
jgi:hypothetical protein